MSVMEDYDFGGWATRNNLRCSDGRVIRKDAFKVNDGKRVPLVWNHTYDGPDKVLGHAILENRDEGVYAYCKFNSTPNGKNAKEAVKHGDVTALSIWANNLQQAGPDVTHGNIREVSLVLAGANPGAVIESVLVHGVSMNDDEDEGIIYTTETLQLRHADEPKKEKEDTPVAKEDGQKTIKDVFDTLNEEQKKAVAIIIGQAIEDSKTGNEDGEEGEEMTHSIFENRDPEQTFLSHSDLEAIVADARRRGSMKEAFVSYIESNELQHAEIDTTGMTVATGNQKYGFNDPSMLFPDYRNLTNTPEWISRNMDWVQKVMSSVHHTPFSRIKSVYANITEDEARARGYIKGKQKKEEVFTTLKRTTDPQTIYKLQKMDRDDILDITEFDVIAWIKAEMRVMLNEELARAILIGDGRPSDSDDKIKEAHIRPIAKDVPLFNTVVVVKVASNATTMEIAKETIRAIIRARKNYKGSGKPKFWTTEDVVTEMLLIENGIGETVYKTEAELATKLRVDEIVSVEPLEGQTITYDGSKYELLGIVVNLADYNVGADKGGEVNMFDDFDIDFNQQKYLIETRCSGSLIRPFSALTIVLDKSTDSAGSTE